MTNTATEPTAAATLTFEDALEELEDIVSELERGETSLETSIERFERGMSLARRCEERLGEAEEKVAVLLKEGSRIVSVDMHTGEPLAQHEDPGDDILPSGDELPSAPVPDDDDIPF